MNKSYAPPKLRQIVLEAVFRRRRVFLMTLVVVLALVTLVILVMHKKYRADAKLMVQNVRTATPLTVNPTDRTVSQAGVSPEEINSEVDLLQSQAIARRAIQDQIAGKKRKDQDVEIATFQRKLSVDPVHQTNLINVSFLANSPSDAEDQLHKVLDSYFELRAGNAHSTGAADFFSRQAQDQNHQLDVDQKALTDFEVAHGIADLDDQKKLQITRIATLQEQLTQADAGLARQISLRDAEQRQLSLTPQRTRTLERTVTNQYAQERFATSLVELENRRSELLKRYVPSDRQVVEINEKIETTRKAIEAAAAQPAGEQATDVNPVWAQLSSALVNSGTEVRGLAAQRDELRSELSEAKRRLTDLEQSTAEFDRLKRKVSQSQQDYTLFSQRSNEARIAEELDKAKMFDVSLVQAPLAWAEPVRPKPLVYYAAALAFALLLGTALALYSDTSAEQVYTPTQLDTLTGMRTVATFADAIDPEANPENNRVEYRRILFALRNALTPHPEDEEEDVPAAGPRSVFEAATNPAMELPAGYAVAFTSATRGEGVSTLVSNLAQEASKQASSRVAVLDMGSLLHQFEEDENLGFTLRYLAEKQYWVLTFDKDNPSAGNTFRHGAAQGAFSARMYPLLADARKEFDFLFLDCPSFAESTLASELDICVDGYMAVVSAGKARKTNIDQMTAVLKESRAPLLGYVLTRRRYPVPGWVHRLLW